VSAAATTIEDGRAVLGIELGSTRIKACLIGDDPAEVIAAGSHEWENQFVDGVWTYSLDDVESGLQSAYAALVTDSLDRHGVAPTALRAIGVSAMMHGYLAFDGDGELLVPFRTWRNTSTGEAVAELTQLFGVSIPQRWSIAHLHQAIMNREDHVRRIRHLTTLAGYLHERLTGERVLGVGDASGMFPVDAAGESYDAELIARYDEALAESPLAGSIAGLLPRILRAGQEAGRLTDAGAALLDPSGALRSGAVLCPPEGDAGTGMVAPNAVAPRTGNVSAGTRLFALVVLDQPLTGVHPEIDIVATPAGAPVAMVHCNNGASELAAWVGTYRRFAQLAGVEISADDAYRLLFTEALEGEADAGGILAYNQVAGEPVAHLSAGRPLVVRGPESRLTLANTMRAHLYGVFATLSLGMRVLRAEGVTIDLMHAHGGIFRTAGVAQQFLAAALDAPVGVAESAAEGGAWGIAVLAAFSASGGGDLTTYLREQVFAAATDPLEPRADDVTGFARYLARYDAGLDVHRRAIEVL